MKLEKFKPIGSIMSNFDHDIEKGAERKLKSGKFWGEYLAWNFNGTVFFNSKEKKFQCEIMQFHSHIDTLKADSLKEIMDIASVKYGSY